MQDHAILPLSASELDMVAGGPAWYVVVAAVAGAVYVTAQAANEIIDAGKELHDAVCKH